MSDADRRTRVDEHVTEAKRLLERSEEHVSNGLERERLLHAAQVHATLALVEALTPDDERSGEEASQPRPLSA